jgi:hypothetical protein
MRYFASILAATFIAIALPSVALADYTYTFTIPVQVSNLPATATLVQVECALYAGPNGNGSGATLGGAPTSQNATPVNGSYSGSFTVKASSPTQPGSYACWLLVWDASNHAINIVNGAATNPVAGWQGPMFVGKNLP